MRKLQISLYEMVERLVGIREVFGELDNPHIMAMLTLDQRWPEHDEVPWCSALINFKAWELRLPRSKDLRARSWLLVGAPISDREAEIGSDIVILKRGTDDGPDVIDAPGHVGMFAGFEGDNVLVLGGNQSNTVSIARYPKADLIGIRRLY